MLDLVAAGRPIARSLPIWASVTSHDLRLAQTRADRHRAVARPQPRRTAELAAANKRIRELGDRSGDPERARELLREPHDPKGGTRP